MSVSDRSETPLIVCAMTTTSHAGGGFREYHVAARDGSPILTVANLFDLLARPRPARRSCAMAITRANDFVGEVHDRMPDGQ
jgi:hypothetical protein